MGILFSAFYLRHNRYNINQRIFDVQGTRQFLPMMRNYFRRCGAVVVVYSLIDIESFKFAKEVIEEHV